MFAYLHVLALFFHAADEELYMSHGTAKEAPHPSAALRWLPW